MSVEFSLARRLNGWLGALFSGKRNLYQVYGYTNQITFEQKLLKYVRQDIAGRIVDAPAQALWTNPPVITSTSKDWNKKWNDVVARQKLYTALERVDKLSGIGRYAVILVGFNDGGSLDSPVNTRSIKQKEGNAILYLQPYSEMSVKVEEYDRNEHSSRFMKPLIYSIQPMKDIVGGIVPFATVAKGGGNLAGPVGAMRVHYSRILHVAENTLENEIFGIPRLERVYNLLDDLLKVVGSSAETFWLTANRGLHIDIDKEMELDPQDAKNLTDEIDEYTHQLRRVIRTRGAKISGLGTEVADPRGAFDVLISMISGATGIPRRILTGSEAGQLASVQDRANWADRIDERRANWANPVVLYAFMKLLTDAGYLPSDPSIQVTIDWPSAFKLSPLENAQTSAQHARSAVNFAKTFETMEKLKRGEPAQAPQLDEEGNEIPGTGKEAVPGVAFDEELITIEEARKMIGLDKPIPTYDSTDDIKSQPK